MEARMLSEKSDRVAKVFTPWGNAHEPRGGEPRGKCLSYRTTLLEYQLSKKTKKKYEACGNRQYSVCTDNIFYLLLANARICVRCKCSVYITMRRSARVRALSQHNALQHLTAAPKDTPTLSQCRECTAKSHARESQRISAHGLPRAHLGPRANPRAAAAASAPRIAISTRSLIKATIYYAYSLIIWHHFDRQRAEFSPACQSVRNWLPQLGSTVGARVLVARPCRPCLARSRRVLRTGRATHLAAEPPCRSSTWRRCLLRTRCRQALD